MVSTGEVVDTKELATRKLLIVRYTKDRKKDSKLNKLKVDIYSNSYSLKCKMTIIMWLFR